MDSEIMQVLLEEARESYDTQMIIELQSDGPEDVDNNVDRIQSWITTWCKDNV
jgi:adenylate kinase